MARFCSKCGAEVSEADKFCKACGAGLGTPSAPTAAPITAKQKDRGVTLLLAILVGLIGFYGIGHVYLGRITRGVAILITDFVFTIIVIVSLVTFVLWPLAVVFGLASLGLFVWQVIDANSLVNKYNKALEETGKSPW